jgi:hypothetical protein
MSYEPKHVYLGGPQNQGSAVLGSVEMIAAGALAIVITYLVATESLVWVPFLLGGLAGLVALLMQWPHGATIGLLVAGTVPRWFVAVSSWNAKPEHVVAAACGGVLLFRICTKTYPWQKLEKLDFLLLAFLATNYVSSYVFSPDPASTLRWALLQTLAASPFFIVRQLVTTEKQFEQVMVWWLWIGAAEASFGILCYLSNLLFGTTVGITLFFYIGFIPGVHGSLWEPNIFGSYCTCFAVMYLFYYLADERRNTWYMVAFALSTVGLLLSLARQAWVCLIFVGGAVLFYGLRGVKTRPSNTRQTTKFGSAPMHRTKRQWTRFAFTAIAVLVAFWIALTAMQGLSDRLLTLSVDEAAEDPTVVRRAGLLALAVEDIQQHPILGLGSSSFQLLYLGEDDSYQGVGQAWLGSFFFRIVHDTGIIGMTLVGWFIMNLGRRAWRVLLMRTSTSTAVGALLAGSIVMLIAYQLTDASTLAFTWIHLGLLSVGVRVAEGGVAQRRIA